MIAFGLDIGTTTCCCVATDGESGALLGVRSSPNDCFLPTADAREVIQDPQRILGKAQALLSEMESVAGRPDCIGLTGQMHGIVYVNGRGDALSPLYTWQDTRAAAPIPGQKETWLDLLRGQSGTPGISAGDGMSIHHVNQRLGVVPADAAKLCTIQDYVGMKLTGGTVPRTHGSDAASFGLYDLAKRDYRRDAIRAAGLSTALLPDILDGYDLLGHTLRGVPVAVALGDNQASFAGSLQRAESSLLLNIGTGGQVSFLCDEICDDLLVQTRPYMDGRFIWAGLTLASGRSYAVLEKLFRSVVRMATGAEPPPLFDKMTAEGAAWADVDPLQVCTQVTGNRLAPNRRGSIANVGERNLTAGALIRGFLRGILDELQDMYHTMLEKKDFCPQMLVGSGNGIRKNPLMRRMIEETFGMPLLIPVHAEEAAYGAALYALCAVGAYRDIGAAQHACVRYRKGE